MQNLSIKHFQNKFKDTSKRPLTMIKLASSQLARNVKDLYNENTERLKKEIKEDTRMWKDFSYSCIQGINIEKWLPYQK